MGFTLPNCNTEARSHYLGRNVKLKTKIMATAYEETTDFEKL